MLAVAMRPLVTGVATDGVPLAELGRRPLAALEIVHKMVSFEHGIGLLPGHRFSSDEGWEKCQPCARTPVTYVPGLYRCLPNNSLERTQPQRDFMYDVAVLRRSARGR